MSLDFKNMPNERKGLIRLFAANSLAQIELNPDLIINVFNGIGGITNLAELQQVTGYNAFYEKLYMVKRQMETILENEDGATQVKHLLSAVISLKLEDPKAFEKKNILKELVTECQQSHGLWAGDPSLADKYKLGIEMIDEWVDFFLSYTNRDQPELNTSYSPDLEKSFKRQEWNDSYDKTNFLAKLIIKYIKTYNSLNAFFDQESMVNGDDLNASIFKYCEKTFAFAQLVEPIGLAFQHNKTNWCYDEYSHFSTKNEGNMRKKFFIKTHKMPEVIHANYQNWYTDIQGHLNYTISQPFNKNALQEECGKIAKQIVDTREQMITNYIASI